MIGRTLGSYRIVEQIGMGGMATVYKAYDPNTERFVAIKTLPPMYSQDPTFQERFRREAKAIAQLEHLHILPIFAYGEEERIAYMVMRYMDTGTLGDMIRHKPMALNETHRLISQLAEALDYAHSHGIIHRDVKPSNVLIDQHRNAYLTDFGIAKMVEGALDLTGSSIIGTPQYMSPEQCRGERELSPASDQYSLGVILYEMVTGRTPFQAETPMAIIHKHMMGEHLPLPHTLRPDLPEAAENVILKALSKAPTDRYATCTALAKAFGDALIDYKVPDAPTLVEHETTFVTDPTELSSPAKRRFPTLYLLGIMLLIVAVLIGLWGVDVFDDDEDREGAVLPSVTATPTLTASSTPTPTETPVLPPTITWTPRPTATALPLGQIAHSCGDGGNLRFCIANFLGVTVEEFELDVPGRAVEPFSWSPDGEQLVFAACYADDCSLNSQLFIINKDGAGLKPLETLSMNSLSPSWSPDGEWIAFHGNCGLFKIHPDSTNLTELVNQQSVCAGDLRWSPNGEWIAFVSSPMSNLDNVAGVWLVRSDGREAQVAYPIPAWTGSSPINALAWTPEGALVFSYNNKALLMDTACLETGCSESSFAPYEGVIGRSWLPNYAPQWSQ